MSGRHLILALLVLCVSSSSLLLFIGSSSGADASPSLIPLGIALYEGSPAVLIQCEGHQEFYRLGDWVRGFTLKEVEKGGIVLSQEGEESFLPLFSSASSSPHFTLPVLGRISSAFGWRTHPVRGKREFHSGVDIAVPWGTPVRASASGTVVFAGRKAGYGRAVVVRHSRSYRTLYGHLYQLQVKRGQQVTQGEIIGMVGSTGVSTGPHVHFEIQRYEKPLDPFSLLPRPLWEPQKAPSR